MLDKSHNPILEHNREAAALWGAGGRSYDHVSFAISDALAHAAQRLAPTTGETVLDCATGTGWTARNCARMGARVSAVDIAPELLSAAEELSTGYAIQYRLADVENLPFAEAAFDGVISTFGAMFAADHARTAAELGRICKPGGRLVLANWVPDGAVAAFFGLIAEHSGMPEPQMSPLAWGDPVHVGALLGNAFDLVFERGTNHAYHQDEDAIWNWYVDGFGPLRSLCKSLNEDACAELKRAVDAYHHAYRREAGLCVKRDYLVVIGKRL